MTKRSTIYEVAKLSGVSTATVSRVMQRSSGYSATTRDRVLAAAQEIGWLPSGTARGLARQRAGIVGLLFADLASSGAAEEESPLYVDQVIRGVERAATTAGEAVLIAATRGSSGRELALSLATKVDGLLIVAHSLRPADIRSLGERLPVVVLSGRVSRRANLDSVSADNRGGMRALVQHLVVDHGHRDLVFVAGPLGAPDSADRFAGFREALRSAGLDCPKGPHAAGNFTQSDGARAVASLLRDRPVPDAVVCANDEMAFGALTVFAERRLRVPDDVAVTGFDNLALARHVRPSLTTVAQPMRDLGAEAVRLVLARVREPGLKPQVTVLPTSLVIRRSCGCPAPAGRDRSTEGAAA
jgi:LacI family transcriptional regulator